MYTVTVWVCRMLHVQATAPAASTACLLVGHCFRKLTALVRRILYIQLQTEMEMINL